MQDTLFDSQLVERDFGSHVLHVPAFLKWVESKGLILPPSNPQVEEYKFAQVEALLCAIGRACSSMTPQQALDVVLTMPELSAHRLHDADADDEYIERVGVCVLRKNPPKPDGTRIARWQPGERGDANFARWQLSAGAHLAWRKLIAAGVRNKEIALFDFASKLPIAHSVAIACCDLVVEPGQVPAARPQAETKPAESGKKANWHDDARAIADELHLRDLAAGAHCALAPMGDRVAKIMRERGIEGPQGPVSGATVKREALQSGKWKRPTPQKTTGGNGGNGGAEKP